MTTPAEMKPTPQAVHINWNEAQKLFYQARLKDQDEVQPLTQVVHQLEAQLNEARMKLITATADRDGLIEKGSGHHDMVTLWCETHKKELPPVPADYADPNHRQDLSDTRIDAPETPR